MVNFNTTQSEYYILPNKNVVVTLNPYRPALNAAWSGK